MHFPIRLLAIIALMALLGCESGWIKASKMNKLSLGMTRPEVLRILGEPHSTEARSGEEKLWYLEDQGGYRHQPYFVTLIDGKVTEFGPSRSAPVNVQSK